MSTSIDPFIIRYEIQAETLREELRQERARCDRFCATWNTQDKDCEIYGMNHPSPANCYYYIRKELELRIKKRAAEKNC